MKGEAEIVTLSNGLWLHLEHCQAVTVPMAAVAALNLPQPIVCHVFQCVVRAVLGVCLSAVTVGCDMLSKNESLGQCVC